MRTILLALLSTLLASSAARAAGEAAPDFTLRDVDGKTVALSQYKGQVVLMSFWATWCMPCQVEMPHLQRMYSDLKEKGFTVLSISVDDARASSQVKPLVKRNGYTFPVLLDKDTQVVGIYNPGKALPYAVLVDREQRIARVHHGYNPGDETALRAEIEKLIAGTAL